MTLKEFVSLKMQSHFLHSSTSFRPLQYIYASKNLIDTNICISEKPPSFACHRDASIKKSSVITYENCKVHTDGMNAQTGVFTIVVIIWFLLQ